MKRYIYMLLMLLVTLLPVGCSDDYEMFSQAPDEKVHCRIGVTVPGISNSETRAFGNENFVFSDLYVAVFVDIDGVSYLEEFVRSENSLPTWNDEDKCWDFDITLKKTDSPRRLHIIANYPNLTMGFGEEGQLIGRLMANGNNHDVYWNYRDVSKIDDDFELEVRNVPLVRNYAKIELLNNIVNTAAHSFELTGYALYNVPTKGTVAPYNPSGDEMFANYIADNGRCQSYMHLLNEQKYEGNEPYDDGTLLSTDINWILPNSDGTMPCTYIYERSNRRTSSPTCLIIRGRYNGGNETYYKLDFVYEDSSTKTKVYYNLIRNFIYTMNLTSVSSSGYNSVNEALKQPASNNIGGDAVAKDFTNISDGAGRLFVSRTSVLFTNNNPVDVYYKYIPDITSNTINNSAVTITAPAGNVLAVDAKVAAGDEVEGVHVGWRKVTLTPKNPSTVAQSQELTFAADNLQRHIQLLLRNPYNLSLQVTPELVNTVAKTPIDVDITLPSGLPVSIFPLRLFISSEHNTIYPQYGTDMPADAYNGKYGFIREVSLVEYEESANKVFNSKFLTNCENSATTVYVDNEYFNRGSDSFRNPWLNSLTLGTSIKVDIERIYSRYPYRIYNNGSNNGTETVTVTLNGDNVGDITIDRDNVTKGITFTNSEGLSQNDEVVFTFTDNYWYGQWSTTPVTYKAVATLGEISTGTTLMFKAQGEINKLTSITITKETFADITVQRERINNSYNVYPKNIHNNNKNNNTEQNNNGSESVSIYYRGSQVGTMTIKGNGGNPTTFTVTVTGNSITINDNNGIDIAELEFRFQDYRCTGRSGNKYSFNTNTTYTADCADATIDDIINNTLNLDFTR